MKDFQLVKLNKAITEEEQTHSYAITHYDIWGKSNEKRMRIHEVDSQFGKLRMDGKRYAIKYRNCFDWDIIDEDNFNLKMEKWSS